MAAGPRVLELYCGIGGCAAALPSGAEVVAALDISEPALAVYRRNFPHAAAACTLESLRGDDPRLRHADLWWLSPPCQPFTRRGRGDDVDDPRSASFLHLLTLVARVRPPLLALENVPQFLGSRAHARLRAVLDDGGYDVRERLLCPTELGVPNRRRRFYLVASRAGFATEAPAGVAANATSAPAVARSLATYLDAEDDPALLVDERLLARYAHAIDVVEAADAGAVAATFTAAYGRSPVRAGSYLRRNARVRRFSPPEILRLLGFPTAYSLPAGMPARNAWRLLGNSLSVPAVRATLALLPGFR